MAKATRANELVEAFIDVCDNEYASVAEDGIKAGEITRFIDTGSYTLNGLLSGSIYGGLPANIITIFAGDKATGKTYLLLSIIKHFQQKNPDGLVVYFESESALDSKRLRNRGVDTKRMVVLPVATIEDFRTQILKILATYKALGDKRPPIIICLDSLGNLGTLKEMADAEAGENKADVGARAKLIKGLFRVLTLKLGVLQVPLLVTNHVYTVQGAYVPTKQQGGGSGPEYLSSSCVFLSKKKIKEDGEVLGNIIHCRNDKARVGRENATADIILSYDTGMDRYGGLVDIALEGGIFTKISTQIQLPDGKKTYEKTIMGNPEAAFTKEVLDQIDQYVRKAYRYGCDADLNVTAEL